MAKRKRPYIPLHSNELQQESGIRVHRFDTLVELLPPKGERVLEAHRDDHYIFILQQSGQSRLMLDFAGVELNGSILFFILPGQVHHYVDVKNFSGWFLAIESRLIGDQFSPVFEDQRFAQQLIAVADRQLLEMSVHMLKTYLDTVPAPNRLPSVLHAMIHSFTGLAAALCLSTASQEKEDAGRRAFQLLTRFRKLLSKHFLSLKSPAAYAQKMNLSLSYLNEMIRKATGLPVSYWIREEIMLEAKRLLCYTDLDVKEVAYRLGFSDHAYFSRLFRKAAGETPLDFRRGYRVMSNHPA